MKRINSDSELKPHEIEILVLMNHKGIRGNKYRAIELVSRVVGWERIRKIFRVNKNFKSVMRRLKNLGLVHDDGKSMKVVALTHAGVLFAEATNSCVTYSKKR